MALFTTRKIAAERLEVCFSCEQITRSTPKRCVLCSCFMRAKVQLRKAACPIGRWGAAPLAPIERQDFAAYWREENEIIELEMAQVPASEAEYALSSAWPAQGRREN